MRLLWSIAGKLLCQHGMQIYIGTYRSPHSLPLRSPSRKLLRGHGMDMQLDAREQVGELRGHGEAHAGLVPLLVVVQGERGSWLGIHGTAFGRVLIKSRAQSSISFSLLSFWLVLYFRSRQFVNRLYDDRETYHTSFLCLRRLLSLLISPFPHLLISSFPHFLISSVTSCLCCSCLCTVVGCSRLLRQENPFFVWSQVHINTTSLRRGH